MPLNRLSQTAAPLSTKSHFPPPPPPLRSLTLPPPLPFPHTPQGANQAAAAAKLGYPTHFVGQVGRDAYAGMLRTALSDCGVDTAMLHSVDGSSGIAFIMLQPGGENSIVLVGGANTSEEWQITDEVTAAIQAAGAVLLQREIPEVVNVIFAKVRQVFRYF